jgi:hypothetical protein
MALRAHKNYYPPARSVEVANDHSWSWDGRQWHHNGRVDVPRNRPLRGVAGGPLSGWFYDWHQFAWMEPVNAGALPPHGGGTVHPIVRPQPPAPPPVVHEEHHHHHPPMRHHEDEHCAGHDKPSIYEGIKDHWVVPLVGVVLMAGADFMTQPQPPIIPDTLPETVQKQWMMIYQQNLNSYSTRKAALEKYGNMLLALGLGNAATSEANKNHELLESMRATQQNQADATAQAAQVAQAANAAAHADAVRRARGAM